MWVISLAESGGRGLGMVHDRRETHILLRLERLRDALHKAAADSGRADAQG
jgi:hypothetical protein